MPTSIGVESSSLDFISIMKSNQVLGRLRDTRELYRVRFILRPSKNFGSLEKLKLIKLERSD